MEEEREEDATSSGAPAASPPSVPQAQASDEPPSMPTLRIEREDDIPSRTSQAGSTALTAATPAMSSRPGGPAGEDFSMNAETSTGGTVDLLRPSASTASSPSAPTAQPTQPSASISPGQTTPAHAARVKLQLMAVGRAPRLTQSKFFVQASEPFRALFPVLRRLLQLKESEALFVFVNSAFAPAPEDKFGDLQKCFSRGGALIINYSLDEAWG
ncbi:hypothetical protein NSK_002718 [Nannochloropsis salina CCMP1776]|uniref:Ubiquitin-like protein ATG12 n=1 Tax=Nannochloropsis salina CCMP1776 TaxID=1027361 RepID=A0A4D9DB92_9STRA|nr:hypothetical protein NSK_002718 [Nannochloropsis salina CCMP1776]|eukprot:TFJ85898.1 hypothetical protein NSK_002718 [Nannochloropsis salina CCMP1776]